MPACRAIATRVHGLAVALAASLRGAGIEVVHDAFFDTITVRVPGRAEQIAEAARARRINLRIVDADTLGITLDETTTPETVAAVAEAFGVPIGPAPAAVIPADLRRTSAFLTHPVFSAHRSEHQMLRYLRELADRDLALDRTMIPLGSCTMKLNATAEMEPITWPEWGGIHPFAPADQARGYRELIGDLERTLAEITGYDAVSLQPNAGSQGEYAGLLAIRRYHESRGDGDRDVCLIPESAHGTNAASAAMAGMRVVVVKCDENGNVELEDLERKATEHGDRLAALMVTYPSTHGVFEEAIGDICARVHDARRPGVPRRREPQRARRRRAARANSAPTCRTSTCTRRSASRTVGAARESGRSGCGRTWRRSCPTTRSSSMPGPPAAWRSARRRGDRRGSCRSRGRTSR